jgi:hypothetical protein
MAIIGMPFASAYAFAAVESEHHWPGVGVGTVGKAAARAKEEKEI